MRKGALSVHTENIFPIIKKFLYSDHEIFLRELVSNAVDATQKLKTLASTGEFGGELDDLTIKVAIDKEARTLTISDSGIGMTEEEVEKYINQVAFSSAEEFVQKYADTNPNAIIGHFGLGFYSAFMVSSKVELNTLSWKDNAEPVKWICDGTTEFEMEKGSRDRRGTDVILYINEENDEFLEEARIETILKKYCRFMPVPIEFKGEVINKTEPLWLKKPSEITDEQYKEFYHELYPYAPDPLFWIHLNIDYPFNLTGILYFPKIDNALEIQKNKIQLYSNQVFVTDEVKEIVPEFLTLLHGVIDSPDIPLNVSRSYLQSDQNVKRISGYIVRKVADKLAELFKNDRAGFESKWPDTSFFIKYGMLTDDKFYEKAKEFTLMEDMEGKFYTLDEYTEKTKPLQTDKSEQLVWLYTSDPAGQHPFVDAAQKYSYSVLEFDHPIDTHFIQLLESKLEKLSIRRVDSGTMDQLIDKGETKESVLSEDERKHLDEIYKGLIEEGKFTVKAEPLSPEDAPLIITQSEWMRRFRDMSRLQGTGNQDFPGAYDLIVNTNHPVNVKLAKEKNGEAESTARQLLDLAKLSQGLLTGKELSEFVNRSIQMMEQK
jgi:molecular chaperone HtpG